MRTGRRGATAAAITIAVIAPAVLASPSATAAAYRYWTYWQAPAGGWAFATAGPATTLPADGAVEGWRFAITSASGRASDQPQAAPDFAAICGATPAEEGRKRVALVLDFGTEAAAPAGEAPPALRTDCVVADADATGYTILRSIVDVRTNDVGLICALQDYPRTGCADVVDETLVDEATLDPEQVADELPAASSSSAAPDESSPAATVIALAVIAVIAGVALAIARRRRR